MRLQVFLSHSGVSSRRKAMDIIQSGRVKVNGKLITEPSHDVDAQKDSVSVDDRPVLHKKFDYILLNKPEGYVTTKADKFAEKTVFELMPLEFQHLVPVGRLDKNTQGLLLFTNDGDVVYKLTHPSQNVDKIYYFEIEHGLDARTIRALERGVMIEDERTSPAKLKMISEQDEFHSGEITIHEGRKRQIRLMFKKVGNRVIVLRRVAQGPLRLDRLLSGSWRHLTEDEIRKLKKL